MNFLLTWSNTNFPLVDLPLFSFSFAALLALLPSLLPLGVCGRGGKEGGGLGLAGVALGRRDGAKEKNNRAEQRLRRDNDRERKPSTIPQSNKP
jgi:hypothetical protein